MGTIISTILGVFIGEGGPGQASTGIQSIDKYVSTQAIGRDLPGTQYISHYIRIYYRIKSLLHHGLYLYIVLGINELGQGAPSPRSAGGKQGGIWRTPPGTPKFFQPIFHCQYPGKILNRI